MAVLSVVVEGGEIKHLMLTTAGDGTKRLAKKKFKGAAVTTSTGREEVVRPSKFAGKRGGRGRVVLKRGSFVSWEQPVTRYDLSLAAVDADKEQSESEQQDLLLNQSEGES